MDPGTEQCSLSLMYLKSAFLAMEPPDCLISLARQSGGGSVTTIVQSFILEHCVPNAVGKGNQKYMKNILKKIIAAAESSCDNVVEGLYEQFAYHMTLPTEDDWRKENNIICKQISFLFLGGHNDINSSSINLVVPLKCSLNILEGDTGCALWPSSLFLSEFILSYPKMFSNKVCFEVGSGVGLVGITLTHAGASKVVLTDGDMSSLANMKLNLELNQLNTETKPSQRTCESPKLVECKYLPWESASEGDLRNYQADIVLGADIIYDPLCMPHLIRVLSILLKPEKSSSSERERNDTNGYGFTHHEEESNHNIPQKEAKEAPVAYIATVIRSSKTFDYFLKLAGEARLYISHITEIRKPLNLLPYMLSYDRSKVHLYKVSCA